ncbi:MAG: aspartate--tRNA(Asn) ligase [bacterium]|nr:aspartate--tRNA(Asn) ligase [bacterium]
MERTLIGELGQYIGQTVTIAGWVDVRRDHGKLIFLDIRDRSGTVQVICSARRPEALAEGSLVRSEWVVSIEGIVNERPEKMRTEGPSGGLELEAINITVIAQAAELPFEKDAEVNIDTLLDYRPLTLRSSRERAVFKIQSEILAAYRAFLAGEGFVEFQAPRLIGDDAEGSGEVFEVPYFYGKTAHLATSPQLYKQIMVGVFERVFTTGNVFRAEKHSTTRHLNEYTSLDMEMGFVESHTDVMAVENRLMRYISEHLKKTCVDEFALLGTEIPLVPDEIPWMKLREAQELIFKETGKDSRTEPDLDPEDERWLCEWSRREHDCDFVFVTHYPVAKRPFYTMEDSEDPGYTKSFDLLFRGVEITTGGQRRHDYENLVAGARMKGLDPDTFSFYLQAFKYGIPPHGGWGMGLERLTQKMCGLASVKEATLFPRDINRIDLLLHDTRDKSNAA